MYKDKKILAVIPARGGSKGIPNKNIRMLGGKPLIVHTIDAALNCPYIDYVMVSTDSLSIAEIAQENGASVPFLRPSELAGDTAKTIDVLCHVIDELGRESYDILVLLQPTSPLRDADDISGAIEMFIDTNQRSLVSVSLVNDHPLLMRTIDEKNRLTPIIDVSSSSVRRQDFPPYYRLNGAIYINYVKDLNQLCSLNDNSTGYIMHYSHSIDIDEMIDLKISEYYLSRRENKV